MTFNTKCGACGYEADLTKFDLLWEIEHNHKTHRHKEGICLKCPKCFHKEIITNFMPDWYEPEEDSQEKIEGML